MKTKSSFYDVLDYCYLKNYNEWVNVINIYGETYRCDGMEDSFICPHCKIEITKLICDEFKLTPKDDVNSYFYCPNCGMTI